MNRFKSFLTFSFCFFFFCLIGIESEDLTSEWNLKINKDGIEVYTRSVENFPYDETIGNITLDTSISRIERVLRDVENFYHWIPDTRISRLVKREGDHQYHYLVTEVPLLKNRDTILHYHYQPYSEGLKVLIKALPEYLPRKSKFVRIPYAEGFWIFTIIEEDKTFVQYQLRSDPGGSIPPWMVNGAIANTPFHTLKNLRTYLNKTTDF